MSVANFALDLAKYLREGKRYKTEQGWKEKEFGLAQSLADLKARMQGISEKQEKREAALWEPGGEKIKPVVGPGIIGQTSFQYTAPEGLRHKEARLTTEMRGKELENYIPPLSEEDNLQLGQKYSGMTEQEMKDWEKMQGIMHGYAKELEGMQQGKKTGEEAIEPFDKNGLFNSEIFANIADTLFPELSFYDLVDKGEITKARSKIRDIAVGRYAKSDANTSEIERALDAWVERLFEISGGLSDEQKKEPWWKVAFEYMKQITPGSANRPMEAISPERAFASGQGRKMPQVQIPQVQMPQISIPPYKAKEDFTNIFGYQIPQETIRKDPAYKIIQGIKKGAGWLKSLRKEKEALGVIRGY